MDGFKLKLNAIQIELKAPKNLYNSFGKYKYRNAEGICEAVKPLLDKYEVALTITDDIVEVGGRIYVKATATLLDCRSAEDAEGCALFQGLSAICTEFALHLYYLTF